MSLLSAKLAAMEVSEKVRSKMIATPAAWTAGLQDLVHVQRYGQTLRYLQACYQQLPRVVPLQPEDRKSIELLSLLDKLHKLCASSIELTDSLLGALDDDLVLSGPKFYYTELRTRRKCRLPDPPKVLFEDGLMRFLAIEVVAGLRSHERFQALTQKNGTEVSPESWQAFADNAQASASEIIAAMILIFGEHETETELLKCIKDEQEVVTEMLQNAKVIARSASSAAIADNAAEEGLDDAEDSADYCVVNKPVFIVSDCTGESAERTVRAALGQFGHCFERSCPVEVTTFRFCIESMAEDIVKQAHDRHALVVFTLVDPHFIQTLVEACQAADVDYFDLWSPLLSKLGGYFGAAPLGVPGRRQFADDKYMQMIDCIEYTRMQDDGVNPKKWNEADIMLIGPSRSGKTPLAFFMAQRGYKVANYPIVPNEDPPHELWDFDQDHIFALDIAPQKLAMIRNNRMKTLNMGTNTSYAQLNKITEEMRWINNLYKKNPKWLVIDTTDSGIEESCAKILRAIDMRGGVQSRLNNKENPSAI